MRKMKLRLHSGSGEGGGFSAGLETSLRTYIVAERMWLFTV